eukprot:NODE_15738_length_1033_cov_4.792494.p2 GENE.NODE_15738_length_1033_cov_4.792494~~NODE_15738_length_1033_cov_4.792494.p2  ORF type:complete len:332 (+),score=154.11 NODE_15738_length_1033_cov_4.792494:49-996(+)
MDSDVLRYISNLVNNQPSPVLEQLERRLALAVKASRATGADPFDKVRGLIMDFIDKLKKEAAEAATKKSWCDAELKDIHAKKEDSENDVNRWQSKYDETQARINQLTQEVAQLQGALAEWAGAQKEMEATRKEAHELYVKSTAEMKQGIAAVQMALKVIRNYYGGAANAAHNAATGAGSSLIGIMEVVESDMAKTLAVMATSEQEAAAQFVKDKHENKLAHTNMEQDVKYKTKERTALERGKTEVRSDLEDAQAQLKTNLEYLAKIEERCVEKVESYESRKARRDALIQSLKDALEVLYGRAVLLQSGECQRVDA